jgi:hypothetical protein
MSLLADQAGAFPLVYANFLYALPIHGFNLDG